MIPTIGFLSLILAFAVSLLQSTIPLVGAQRKNTNRMSLANSFAAWQFIMIAIAFLALAWSFVVSDFSVKTVAANSHSAKPMLYKISGTWGNHEGSMLLWVLILSLFGACVACSARALPSTLKARVLAVQGMIGAAFLAFILLTSNPFTRISPVPADGAGLNPLLQDPGLAFHPPFLYLGYVGFSIAFSFSVAVLIEGELDTAWAGWVRSWVLAAWGFLTIGITLGSWWAYYELGWGGWWFWDPVENASFMPWLVGTALLHSILVVERRQTLVRWTLLLGILAFTLSLIGTFLVRSGVLTSVHTFAVDPGRGVFILVILAAASCGALGLYAVRAPYLKTGPAFAPVSREGFLILNNIFLVCAAATVFLGTFYPLLIEVVSKDKISVGPPYFNKTFVPIILPMLVVMSMGPLLKWRSDTLKTVLRKLVFILPVVVAAIALVLFFGKSILSAIGIGLAVWLVLGALLAFFRRIRLGEVSFTESLKIARILPRAGYGVLTGHAAMGVCVAGITAMSFWSREDIRIMEIGDAFTLSGYEITLDAVDRGRGPNYLSETATVFVKAEDRLMATLKPERRFYPVRGQLTTEAGIRVHPMGNIYVSIGESTDSGRIIHSYYHPLVSWIWFGALGMALAGFVALSDRRFSLSGDTVWKTQSSATKIRQPGQ